MQLPQNSTGEKREGRVIINEQAAYYLAVPIYEYLSLLTTQGELLARGVCLKERCDTCNERWSDWADHVQALNETERDYVEAGLEDKLTNDQLRVALSWIEV